MNVATNSTSERNRTCLLRVMLRRLCRLLQLLLRKGVSFQTSVSWPLTEKDSVMLWCGGKRLETGGQRFNQNIWVSKYASTWTSQGLSLGQYLPSVSPVMPLWPFSLQLWLNEPFSLNVWRVGLCYAAQRTMMKYVHPVFSLSMLRHLSSNWGTTLLFSQKDYRNYKTNQGPFRYWFIGLVFCWNILPQGF